MDSSAARSITRSSATKASGSKPVPAPGLTGTRHGIIITLGSVFDTTPPLIGGGVRVCFFLRSPALSLTSAALPFIMNTWKHSRPPLIGGRVKCFLFFVPAPRLYRAGRVNPNTLSGFALAPTHGGAGRATRPQKQRPLSGMQRHRRSTTHGQTRQDGRAAGLSRADSRSRQPPARRRFLLWSKRKAHLSA